MMKNKKKFAILFLLIFFLAFQKTANAQGWVLPTNDFGLPDDFDDAILNITNFVLGFVTSLAVLAIIWGGIKYLYSAGDQNTATEGKKVIKYALMGLVIAGISYALVVVIVEEVLR